MLETVPDIVRSDAVSQVRHAGGHVQGTLNMPDFFHRRGLSLCQGKLYDPAARWWQPGTGVPDGSYAIVRENDNTIEAVTDPGGTRTVWYYFDDEVFVVSNSQRAITMVTGRFDFEPAVVPWIVATGSLGHRHSYNRHLRLLPPASTVALDKARWRLRTDEGDVAFEPVARSDDEHLAAVDAALRTTFAAFDGNDRRTATVSLSGGVDSRVIACLLSAQTAAGPVRTFSGGVAGDLDRPDSDAAVASEVAQRLGADHRLILRRRGHEDAETVMDRFILCAEGRHDQVKGYLDGLESLREIAADGTRVVIRGEQGFCGPTMHSPETARKDISIRVCSDFANLLPHLKTFGLDDHALPADLVQRRGESLQGWHGRLYRSFRMPAVMAALSETKAAFVDTYSPLMSARALAVAASLPDHLRLEKALFRRYALEIGPDVRFASNKQSGGDSMAHDELRRVVVRSLSSDTARKCFGEPLVDWVAAELALTGRRAVRAFWAMRRSANAYTLRLLGHERPHSLRPMQLALRMHIATTMVDQLAADARLLSITPTTGEADHRAPVLLTG